MVNSFALVAATLLSHVTLTLGVLIYSDPKDDGYVRGPVYPDGPWRPRSSVQRGSVQYGVLYDGDPLTPGIRARDC